MNKRRWSKTWNFVAGWLNLTLDRRDREMRINWHLDDTGGNAVRLTVGRSIGDLFTAAFHMSGAKISAHVGGPLGVVYASVENPRLRRLVRRVVPRYGEREVRFRFGANEGAVDGWSASWALWTDGGSWSADEPRWRRGSWYPVEWLFGACDYTRVPAGAPEVVMLRMPEGEYAVRCQREHAVWTRPRWPGTWLEQVSVNVKVDSGVPIPGKGEEAWQLDEDAIFETSYVVETYRAAVERFAQHVNELRWRRGGFCWVPSPKPAEHAAP